LSRDSGHFIVRDIIILWNASYSLSVLWYTT
jgi:hypothetical protein